MQMQEPTLSGLSAEPRHFEAPEYYAIECAATANGDMLTS